MQHFWAIPGYTNMTSTTVMLLLPLQKWICVCGEQAALCMRVNSQSYYFETSQRLNLCECASAECLDMTAMKFVVINNEPIMCKPLTKAGLVAPCRAAPELPDYPRARYKMQARTDMNKHASLFAFCLGFKAPPEMIIYCLLLCTATVEHSVAESVLTNGGLYLFVRLLQRLVVTLCTARFNIQEFSVLPTRFTRISGQTAIISLYSIN
jgi:hypothetical protein